MSLRMISGLLVLWPVTAFACVASFSVDLTQGDIDTIVRLVQGNYPELNTASNVLWFESSGVNEADTLRVIFEPISRQEGFDIAYLLHCKKPYENDWKCEKPQETKLLFFEAPDDFVEVQAPINADLARTVIEQTRKQLLVSTSGEYWYDEYWLGEIGDLVVSEDTLDIGWLRLGQEDALTLNVIHESSCTTHHVIVERVECGLKECDWKIVKNTRNHLL